jgi:hypothetical protein
MTDDREEPLSALVRILKPMQSAVRHRAIKAAMLYLEETIPDLGTPQEKPSTGAGVVDGGSGASSQMHQRMQNHSITTEQLEHAFQVDKDGKHRVVAVPGSSKKERTLNAYLLTGLGNYLYANDRAFTDADARATCEYVRCYDVNNHSNYLKERQSNFNGDKTKGYTVTSTGLKEGAALVKALSAAS